MILRRWTATKFHFLRGVISCIEDILDPSNRILDRRQLRRITGRTKSANRAKSLFTSRPTLTIPVNRCSRLVAYTSSISEGLTRVGSKSGRVRRSLYRGAAKAHLRSDKIECRIRWKWSGSTILGSHRRPRFFLRPDDPSAGKHAR